MMKPYKQKGLTLLEITVVLLILIALAGLAIPYIGGTSRKALCDSTDITMANVKRAIMDRYYLDTLGQFPKATKAISPVVADYNLKYLMTKPDWDFFDPSTQIGWRKGGYLQSSSVLSDKADLLHNKYDLSGTENSFLDSNRVHVALADDDSVILDGWGRPIIIQVRDEADCSDWNLPTDRGQCARLVSAGFGSGIGFGNAGIETTIAGHRPANASDDRILYLNTATPVSDINPPCD